MSAGHSEPQVLYSVNNICAYHVQDGQEHALNASGPQTLSLLMVPTSSPFADLSSADPSSSAPEEDFYLHLHLPPELDLALPATTQIYHKPPTSYLIPRWDLGPESGAFIRVEFPSVGQGPSKVSQEDVDTFETILAQCTAFLERAHPPKGHGTYDPSRYAPGEGYVTSPTTDPHQSHGRIVLIDEENGSVVGELENQYQMVEGSSIKHGSKSRCLHFVFGLLETDCYQLLWRFSCLPRDRGTRFASMRYPRSIYAWPSIPHIRNQPSSRHLLELPD